MTAVRDAEPQLGPIVTGRPRRSVVATAGQYAFPLALLALIAFGLAAYPNFRSVNNLLSMLTFSSILFIVAQGQTLVILGRGVDLSVGSMVGLSGAVYAEMATHGWSSAVAIIAALALGLAIGGLVHGLLITKLKISFLIVTLGTFSILASQALVVMHGTDIPVDSALLNALANEKTVGIPNLVILAAVLYGLLLLVLRCTAYGRSLYAVGSNPEAARLAGIPVDRVVIIAYALCALFAAIAGLLTVGQLGSAQTTGGAGLELTSIAAVLLGGTRFSGGYGSITRTLFGVLFLGVLNDLLSIAGVSSFWQGTASGLVLIIAVAIDRTRRD